MLTDDKVTEIFVMADEFCKVFNQVLTLEIQFMKCKRIMSKSVFS